jgi:hypothetical protein
METGKSYADGVALQTLGRMLETRYLVSYNGKGWRRGKGRLAGESDPYQVKKAGLLGQQTLRVVFLWFGWFFICVFIGVFTRKIDFLTTLTTLTTVVGREEQCGRKWKLKTSNSQHPTPNIERRQGNGETVIMTNFQILMTKEGLRANDQGPNVPMTRLRSRIPRRFCFGTRGTGDPLTPNVARARAVRNAKKFEKIKPN